jgi:hypothetical protein
MIGYPTHFVTMLIFVHLSFICYLSVDLEVVYIPSVVNNIFDIFSAKLTFNIV